ncbi:Fe-S protein assembly co-chaperone HscB [Silvibacterium acidisoli]|uniref:Fe-S protein assembly co-chaperone HscB n=1 Tax=Acidobacteriaceae bacterium ZG23-2 TaxID=2883246 RepID=UPI00406CAF13
MPDQETESVAASCWSCGASLGTGSPICSSCGKVQATSADADYFAVFELSRKLNIDTKALERGFYKLSRKLHPDLYAQAPVQEQQWSLDQSSLLNDAYRALKDPVRRTEYLLTLEGMKLEPEKGDAGKAARAPADLLEEVFELNMQLEEMRMNRKMGEDDPQLRQDLVNAKDQFEGQLRDNDIQIQNLWAAWDTAVDAGDPSQQDQLKTQMVASLDRRRYIRNLVRDVNETLES